MQNRLSFALHPLMLAQGPLPARPLAETPAQRWELAVWLRGPRAGPFSQPPASWTRCGDLKAATGAGCLARSLERPAAPGAAALCRAPGGPVGRAPGAAGRGAHGTAGAGSQPSPGGFSAWATPAATSPSHTAPALPSGCCASCLALAVGGCAHRESTELTFDSSIKVSGEIE